MLVYPSGVDVSSSALRFLTARLREHRRVLGTRWRRLSAGRQALLTLVYLRNGQPYAQLAAGFGIGTTTVYRYVTEAVGLLAVLAPTLAEAMRAASMKAYLILDGTLLPIDRIAADRPILGVRPRTRQEFEAPAQRSGSGRVRVAVGGGSRRRSRSRPEGGGRAGRPCGCRRRERGEPSGSLANKDVIGSGDVASYEAWQRRCGYSRTAAKWPPGKTTWDLLKVPGE
ncbi:transposase family protein [Streptomyces agglomeratus]|uniref:transposase family protein n=1 Tax=Streptomyces agglomeratus TaxID=285458 RepID=UPI000B01DF60|nr:transposase family protein [Streptomyces agglomeratus]